MVQTISNTYEEQKAQNIAGLDTAEHKRSFGCGSVISPSTQLPNTYVFSLGQRHILNNLELLYP
jgi:hypothetical protein